MLKTFVLTIIMLVIVTIPFVIFWPYEPLEVTIVIDDETQSAIFSGFKAKDGKMPEIKFTINDIKGGLVGTKFIGNDEVRFRCDGLLKIHSPGAMSVGDYMIIVERPDGEVDSFKYPRSGSRCLEFVYNINKQTRKGSLTLLEKCRNWELCP